MQTPPTRMWVVARLRDSFPVWKVSLILPAGLMLAWLLGMAVAHGGVRRSGAVALAGVLALVPILRVVLFRRVSRGLVALEVPVLLLLLSTIAVRSRSVEDIAVDPLDPAAQFRVACVGLALLFGGIALIAPTHPDTEGHVLTTPFRLYILYVIVVFAAAPFSADSGLTAYRGIELAAAGVVLAGAKNAVGRDAIKRVEAVLYWFAVAILASVWIGVLLFPDEALVEFQNPAVPINFQVNGVLPAIAANTIGVEACIVAVWSLARVAAGRTRPGRGYVLALVGVCTVLAAQYRTGYVTLILSAGVWLLLRRRWGLASGAVGLAIAVALFFPSAVLEAQPYVLRGQTPNEATELSSRVDWWSASIPVWKRSPLIGRGLLTATRFEVLAPLGTPETSSIHSTWVEALVGTGVLGVALLGGCLLMLFHRAALEARQPNGWIAPLMLLIVLTTRSLTGSSIESFSDFALLFVWLALFVDSWPDMRGSMLAS